MKEIVPTSIPAPSPLFGIAELAHRLHQERGGQEGNQLEDWIEAERRISHDHARARKSASQKKNAAARRTRTWAKRRIRLLNRNRNGAAR